MADAVTLPALPLFVRLADRPVILLGEGDAAAAKRRLLDRAGARIVGEDSDAVLAIVAISDDAAAHAAVARLKARGVLVNAVDRPALCDFTLPAIVDRTPVIVAIGTNGVSAGIAAALRQRLETILPATLGPLAERLAAARDTIRARHPDGDRRRRALGAAMAAGGALDPLAADAGAVDTWLDGEADIDTRLVRLQLRSADPDDLTLREARLIGRADRLFHRPGVAPAILNRARADAERLVCSAAPADPGPGLSIDLEPPA